jgi:hypothetical protein
MSYVRYINCDNTSETLLSLLKQTILTDEDGNWYIRVVAADETELPLSVLTDIECGEEPTLESIIKNLLVYDDDGNLAWNVYDTTP